MVRATGALRVAAAALVALASCVPEGPPTGGAATSRPAARRHPPHAFDAGATPATRPAITAVFEDTFDRAELGPDWRTLSPVWHIERGRLCVRNAHNRGAWLARPIPVNARIEFDAYADAADGDVKVEVWGDGQSGATSSSYSNATSYIAILGGWRNTKHVLARLDEHGKDRLEIDVDPNSDDERARPVFVGQPYHFKIERADGRSVSWSVNGLEYLALGDEEPLAGPGHDHVGFNDWEAPVCFDNLKITPL
ncbi:MAG TPA: hypothetical protein VHB21_25145 [Minicystis sp.]|nr:hypothetical protein [Minicystis sp.]